MSGSPETNDQTVAEPESWRARWHLIIFGHETPAGKAFDAWLLGAILISVAVVVMESVADFNAAYRTQLLAAEYFFTAVFTVEYIVRLMVSPHPWRYARSFYGIVDLLSILPTYVGLFVGPSAGATQGLANTSASRLSTIRALRLLRAFRIFKLRSMLTEADALQMALVQSRAKIAVFISAVLIAVVITGSALHLIEAGTPGFESIPQSMYFTIVTMSTVGYGDISPVTPGGKMLTTAIILLGYSLIVVPTGIVSAEIAKSPGEVKDRRTCPRCDAVGHQLDARYCKRCGQRLGPPQPSNADPDAAGPEPPSDRPAPD